MEMAVQGYIKVGIIDNDKYSITNSDKINKISKIQILIMILGRPIIIIMMAIISAGGEKDELDS